MMKSGWIVVLFLLLMGIIFSLPLLVHPLNWPTAGHHDSDDILARIALAKQAILSYGQFPFWTPAIEGGQDLAFFVPTGVLSPFFILILLFGEILGIKLMATLFLFFGLWGMYLLSRYLGGSRMSSCLASFLFFFSSIYALQVAEGVYYNTSMAWIPWAFLCYLKGFKDFKFIYASALFCTLILFSDAYFPLLFYLFLFMFFYSCLIWLTEKNAHPFTLFVTMAVFVFLLGAVKSLPTVVLIKKHFIILTTGQYNDARVFLNSLFSRQQLLNIPRHELWGLPDDVSFWEQHGAYIGVLPFLLYLAAIPRLFRQYSALILSGLMFLALLFVNFIPEDLKLPINRMPLSLIFAHPSRLVWMFVFSLSLVVGLGLSKVEQKMDRRGHLLKAIVIAVICYITWDLILVNRPILNEAFLRVPEKIEKSEKFEQARGRFVYKRSNMYRAVLENRGLCEDGMDLLGNDVFFCNAVASGAKKYRGEIYLLKGAPEKIDIMYFSPNVIKVKISGKMDDDLLCVNQNYDRDWKVKGLAENKVICTDGLISARVGPADAGVITFYYLPDSFVAGLFISVATLVFMILYRKKIPSLPLMLCLASMLALIFSYFVFFCQAPADGKSVSFETARDAAAKGALYYKKYDFRLAQPYLESARVFFPNSLSIHRMLKDIYEHKGVGDKALSEQREMADLLPPAPK